jgi:coproporphyrinogen III oxidase
MNILDFVHDMKKRALEELLAVSDGGEISARKFEFATGRAELSILRGNAIEKASIAHIDLTGIPMPDKGQIFDITVYQMEVFPRNPRCPMGHFSTEWFTLGEQVTYNMNLDFFPAITVEEDLRIVKKQMRGVAEEFQRNPDESRKGLAVQYNMPHWSGSLASQTGLQLKQLTEGDLPLFVAAYHTFFDGYLDILQKRKDTPCSDSDNEQTLDRNNKWLEYITLKDRAIKAGQTIGIPPEVIIGFSYPPSCGF